MVVKSDGTALLVGIILKLCVKLVRRKEGLIKYVENPPPKLHSTTATTGNLLSTGMHRFKIYRFLSLGSRGRTAPIRLRFGFC